MAVTIHLPQVHRPDMKRVAVAGVAVLATAVAFVGIQAISNNNTNTASSVSDGVVDVTTVDFTGNAAVAEWAQQAGLSGLSPASVGRITTSAVSPSIVPDAVMRATGVVASATTATAVDTQAVVPDAAVRAAEATAAIAAVPSAAEAVWLQYMAGTLSMDDITALGSLGVIPETATTATAQSGGFATQAEFLAANTSAIASAPTATEAAWSQYVAGTLSIDAIAALGSLGVIPETATTATAQSGGFATQAEFLAANTGAALGSVGVIPETATTATAQSGGFATQAEFLAANTSAIASAPTATEAAWSQYVAGTLSIDAIAALGSLGVIPETATTATAQSGGFATQAEFLEANDGAPAP